MCLFLLGPTILWNVIHDVTDMPCFVAANNSRAAVPPLLSSPNVAAFSSSLNQCRRRATAPSATTTLSFANQNRGKLSLFLSLSPSILNHRTLIHFFFSSSSPSSFFFKNQRALNHHHNPAIITVRTSNHQNCHEPPSSSPSTNPSHPHRLGRSFSQTTASEPLTSLAPPPNPNSASDLTLSSTPTSCRQHHHHHHLFSHRTFRETTIANVFLAETEQVHPCLLELA
ncbi:uncharacterized protein DS421_8g232890 [Arachis hypogaea]|nr:uncharacterized protein DS421_8g232890 [Arachis hypogaea]